MRSYRVLGMVPLLFVFVTAGLAADGPQAKQPTLPDSWVKTLNWRSIGPANMSGRITAIAVYEKEPTTWWAATASGGLLKTTNNGITFEHQFDEQATVSIGDVQVAQSDPSIVWVGTGEANPRNSVSWGDGVYKSVDGGTTWKNMGLKKSFQIGRIAIHPTDPNVVYVGALGRLWGPNEERGLYKTTDGGKTWKRLLYVDDHTGVIDVQMHPQHPDTLLVATYERQRDGFDSNDPAKKFGDGAGLYKTTDGGKTFRKLADGLPSGKLGRIGISYFRKDPKFVYAVLESEKIGQMPPNSPYVGIRGENAEVGARITQVVDDGPADKAGLQDDDIVIAVNDKIVHSYRDFLAEVRKKEAGDKITLEVSRNRESVAIEITLGKRPAPRKRRESDRRTTAERARSGSPFAASLGGQVANAQEQQGQDGHEYGGIYRSQDGGESWTRINSVNPRPMYYSQIRVDPTDRNYIWVLGTRLYLSEDGGTTFETVAGARVVHSDHHAMWIDPQNGRHVILGNDGGVYVTFDRGAHWDHLNHVAIGQFYHVAVGPRRDYRVYGGLQDNGSWGGPHRAASGRGPLNTDWFRIGGGDGFVCAVDRDDPDIVYYESQGGATGRINLRTGERSSMRPRPPKGVSYRFNWKTPFTLSPHNPKIYYSAGNYVFRSLYQGNGLKAISPEISRTDRGSATALAESPAEAGVLYVGTNDGALWVTRDGGHQWKCLFGCPEEEAADETKAKPAKKEAADETKAKPARKAAEQMKKKSKAETAKKPVEKTAPPAAEKVPRKVVKKVASKPVRSAKEQPAGKAKAKPAAAKGAKRPPAKTAERSAANGAASAAEKKSPVETAADQPARAGDDPVSGSWEGRLLSDRIPADRTSFKLILRMDENRKVQGTFASRMFEGSVSGTYDPEVKELSLSVDSERARMQLAGSLAKTSLAGELSSSTGSFNVELQAKRTGDAPPPESKAPESTVEPGEALEELVPGPRWVSSIEASRHKQGRVYVTFDGHRSDDDRPYVLVSEDYGETWRSLAANLPATVGSTRVLREDLENEDLLYLGTEFGIWVSVDRGATWTRLHNNLPTVAVHEVAIHPSAGEIVAGTHGRSLWVLDVSALRQMSAATIGKAAHLFAPQDAIKWRRQPSRGSAGTRQFAGENPPAGAVIYYSLGRDMGRVELTISDVRGKTVFETEGETEAGLHVLNWNLRRSRSDGRSSRRGSTVDNGKYLVTLTADDEEWEQVLEVVDEPRD